VRTLGPYTLLRPLGAGGMGEVWAARREALGGATQLVAIKTLLSSKSGDPMARKMFLDEARLSMLLRNSNIVQVFDVAEAQDGTCYMVMELVDGIDLARLVELLQAAGEQISHAAIAYMIGEVLKALAYAHEFIHEGTRRTIVHRDISPHNVMLSTSGEVKLMDFGVARLASEETSGAFVKGKIRYMPPEQLHGESRSPTVDLFAVGAMLHELLDGKKFRGGQIDEPRLIGMVARGEVPSLTCPPGQVPAEFERLRAGLLAPKIKDRIASARAAHRLLRQWPGDRDAKFELEEIVQRYASPLHVEALDSGALSLPSDRSAQPTTPDLDATLEPTAMLPSDDSSTSVRPTGRDISTDQTGERLRETATPDEESITSPIVDRAPTPDLGISGRSRSTGLAMLGALAIGFALLTTGIWMGWWGESENELAKRDAAPSPTSAPPEPKRPPAEQPEPVKAAQVKAAPEAAKVEAAAAKAEPVKAEAEKAEAEKAEAEKAEAVKAEAVKAETKKAEPKKVKVEITVKSGYRWVKIRLNGRNESEIRSGSTIQKSLEPGATCKVEIMDDAETEEWVSLGQPEVPKRPTATLWVKNGKAWFE